MARRAGPTATALTRDWKDLAENAIKLTGDARYGEKDAILKNVAQQHGISVFLIRRAMAARSAIEKLAASGAPVPATLLAAPVGICDIVARWADYDPVAAFRAFDAYERGELTFRGMLAAEVAARPANARHKAARTIDVMVAWRGDCLDRVQRHLKPRQGLTLAERGEALPVDAWIDGPGTRQRGAVIVIGPTPDGRRSEREIASIAVRAVGLAAIGYPCTLVVPYADLAKAYRNWMAAHAVSDSQVTIIGIRAPVPLDRMRRPKGEMSGRPSKRH